MSEKEREGAPPKEEKKEEKRKPEKKQKPRVEHAAVERKLGGVIPPPLDAVRDFVKDQSYVTPFVVAEGFGLKIGVAKSLLRQLQQERVLSPVLEDRKIKIYAPAQPVGEETKEPSQPPATRPKPAEQRKGEKARK